MLMVVSYWLYFLYFSLIKGLYATNDLDKYSFWNLTIMRETSIQQAIQMKYIKTYRKVFVTYYCKLYNL